jgi:hypothetical protein
LQVTRRSHGRGANGNLPRGGAGLTAQGTPAVGTRPSLPVARGCALPATVGSCDASPAPRRPGASPSIIKQRYPCASSSCPAMGPHLPDQCPRPSSASARPPQRGSLAPCCCLTPGPAMRPSRSRAARARSPALCAAATLGRRSRDTGWMSHSPPATARARAPRLGACLGSSTSLPADRGAARRLRVQAPPLARASSDDGYPDGGLVILLLPLLHLVRNFFYRILVHVASMCFTCFMCFRRMLQVFRVDVVIVDQMFQCCGC